jgi:hypothetical protein
MASIARATIGFLCAAAVALAVTPAGTAATRAPAPAAARSATQPTIRLAADQVRGQRPPETPPPPTGRPGLGDRPASVNPRGALGRLLSAAQASAAAQTCARYATAAGWVNSAPVSTLVTATAICVAESGGQATVYYCDPTRQDGYYPPVNCAGLYDRGLWQLDSQAWKSISDACAFAPRCNADAAYGISQSGQSFTPWATYNSGIFTTYLASAQAAVTGLSTGTVPSGILGVCLSRPGYTAGAPAITARCASGRKQQQWHVAGTSIRDGKLCLAAASAAKAAPVVLSACANVPAQQWVAQGNGELRNALAGRCLRDPGGSVIAGTPVNVGSCRTVKSRLWWLP